MFIFYAVTRTPQQASDQTVTAGKTITIGQSMYTIYLLPVEIVGVLLLMAIIGAVILSRRLQEPKLELVVDTEEHRRGDDLVD
jgi:NADH:ubiquinone oxidoreductase subunit 6 (subunit J)